MARPRSRPIRSVRLAAELSDQQAQGEVDAQCADPAVAQVVDDGVGDADRAAGRGDPLAIFRQGLFDIDLIINRALTYGAITAILALDR